MAECVKPRGKQQTKKAKSKKRGFVNSSHVEEKENIRVGDKEKETSSRSSDAAGITCRLDEDSTDSAGKNIEEQSGGNISRNQTRVEEAACNDEAVVRIGGGTDVATCAKGDVTEHIIEMTESIPGGEVGHSIEYKGSVTVEDVITVDSEKGDRSSASAESEDKPAHESCLPLRDNSTICQEEETNLVMSQRLPETVQTVSECVTQKVTLAQLAVDRSMTDDTGIASHCGLPSQCSTVVQATSEERKQVDHYDGIKASTCASPDVAESPCRSPECHLNVATTVSPATSSVAPVVTATCVSPATSSTAPVVTATCVSPATSSTAPVVMATCVSPATSSVAPVVTATCVSPATSSTAPVAMATCESPAMSSTAPVVTATCVSPATSSTAPVAMATCESPAMSSVAPVVTPLTEEQLATIYYNPELRLNEDFIEGFLQDIQRDKTEFYELVLNYYRSRNHLAAAEHDISVLRQDYERHTGIVWSTKTETLHAQSVCFDKARVYAEHTYDTKVFDDKAVCDVKQTLKNIRNHLHDELTLYAYEAHLSRLQVESFLHQVYQQCPQLADIPPNSPVTAVFAIEVSSSVQHHVAQLRHCISVLFMFQRKPAKDDLFVQDLQQWITRLVSTLMRVAMLEDHLFILNHLLRCPAGVGKWAGNLVQVVPPGEAYQQCWGSPLLDHYVTVLATLLMPVRLREKLLCQLQVSPFVMDKKTENPWIFVDSDGEEDEDVSNTWMNLHESDIMSFLNQLPLDVVFRHVLLVQQCNGEDVYDASCSSHHALLKLMAFARLLIRILRTGFETFSTGRYRQLNKRLAGMIRDVVQYVSDHWSSFQDEVQLTDVTPDSLERLRVEFDQLFESAIVAILSAQRLGVWQYLAIMPYTCVTMGRLWGLLCLMHQGCHDVNAIQTGLSVPQCQALLCDADDKSKFEEKLVSMPMSEVTYLLTTFANMARSCSSSEPHFIETVALEIFEIAYVCEHTREHCSKLARDLLAMVVLHHPFVISQLLQCTGVNMDKIGLASHYLFKGLPLMQWLPTPQDMDLLREWLLDSPPTSPQNNLARIVVEQMNWSSYPHGADLFLCRSMHRTVATLLVQMYRFHLAGKNVTSLMVDNLQVVSSPAKSPLPSEQLLSNWIWRTALRLCLHDQMLPRPVKFKHDDIPDIHEDALLHPLVAALSDGCPFANYVALVMTKYGHSLTDVCSDGLKLLTVLVDKLHHVAAINALAYIMPQFYHHSQYLHNNQLYLHVLEKLIQADVVRKGVKGLFYSDFPGPLVKLFSRMIQSQILECGSQDGDGGQDGLVNCVQFWLKSFMELSRWHQDRGVLYVINNIVEAAFLSPTAWEMTMQLFTQAFQKHLESEQLPAGVISSIVTWIASGSNMPSLISAQSCPEFPWYAFAVLSADTRHEQPLWIGLQRELASHAKFLVEPALAMTSSKLKLDMSPAAYRLVIYRWAQQALDTDVDHPLLPLVWQQFFILYMGRATLDDGMPERGSVGERFFSSSTYNSLMKKMKKRANEAADRYHTLATQEAPLSHTADDTSEGGVPSGRLSNDREKKEFYKTLVKFYLSVSFWLDEPRLHDGQLYLPALPPQYDAPRLLTIFHSRQDPWLELVDSQRIHTDVVASAAEWTTRVTHDEQLRHWQTLVLSDSRSEPQSVVARLLLRLRSHPCPLTPPPVGRMTAPVTEVTTTLLCDKPRLLYELRADFTSLADIARLYSDRVTKHVALDCTYLELVPGLYSKEMCQVNVPAPCKNKFKLSHKCLGPANITFKFEIEKANEIVQRKLDENRAEYNQLMIEALLPPPQSVCRSAVHVENVITGLIKLAKSGLGGATKMAVTEAGIALFYHVTTFMNDETKFYPPTRQFFSTCIEILGQEFISNNPSQSQPLLQAIMQTPSLVTSLLPNFKPISSPELFVTIYDDLMQQVPGGIDPEVAFSLLSKFDVALWLHTYCPPLSQRSALLAVIGSALCKCGQQVDASTNLVFEVYKSHLCKMLKYHFPDHYGDALRLLLKGSSEQSLSPCIWESFLSCLDCSLGHTEYRAASGSPARDVTPQTQLHLLTYTQMTETFGWLVTYFQQLRTSTSDLVNFGLYPQWKPYVRYLSVFLHHLVAEATIVLVTMVTEGLVSPEHGLYELWNLVSDLYKPWIQPLRHNDQLLLPWIPDDTEVATEMVGAWAAAIHRMQDLFHGLLPAFSPGPLTWVWTQYATTLALGDLPTDLLVNYHRHFATMPWHQFYPDIADLDHMIQIQQKSACCGEFVATVVTAVHWAQIVERFPPELLSHFLGSLLTLLVHVATSVPDVQNEKFHDMLKAAESFLWTLVEQASFESAVSWVPQNYDPRCVLVNGSSGTPSILSLLKVAAGFVPSAPVPFPQQFGKQGAFVRCLVQLLCRCSHFKDVDVHDFEPVIKTLMTDIEHVLTNCHDPNSQWYNAVSLCTDLLGLLNRCNPEGDRTANVVLGALLQWLRLSPSSPLVMASVTASCRSLASMCHMLQIVEACLDVYFTTDTDQTEECGWTRPLEVLQVPELHRDTFLSSAVHQGSYLTLYGFVLQQLPLCGNIEDERGLLNQMISWSHAVKPSAENEAKLLLWWHKILESLCRQLHFGTQQLVVCRMLQQFIASLSPLAEDKASGGLLAAIGLGRKSQLSLRFRLVAKSLTAFLSAQLLGGDTQLRLPEPAHDPPPTSSSPHAGQTLAHLQSLTHNKQYASLKDDVQLAVDLIKDPAQTWLDAPTFLARLVARLFVDKKYLEILRRKQ